MNIKSVLSKNKHFINIKNKLKLDYKTFTYPPFYDYQLVHFDPNIMIEDVSDRSNIFAQEGCALQHTKYFSFLNKGNYKISIKKYHPMEQYNTIEYIEIVVKDNSQ